jgi:DNA modification methylase
MEQTRFNHPRIEMVPISSLKPNQNNARKHSPKQLALIGTSLSRWGFLVPIVTDKDGTIVAGMGRYLAAQDLNYDHVPIISREFLSEADRRAFALAENRLAELGGWDDDLLQVELKFLFEADYDLTVTGFELKDLDFTIGDVVAKEEAVQLPALGAVAVSRPGDHWLFDDRFSLYCGNARHAESYEIVLRGEQAAMVIADPPYNVLIDGHVSGLGKVRHSEFLEASGELNPSEFTAFLRSIFRNCARFSTDGSIHYHCMDWRHVREILDAADGVYSQFKQLVVWNKAGNAGMGSFYRSQHELIFVFKSGRGRHTNNFSLGETGRYRTNVWDYPGCNTFRKGRAADLEAHPTVKPLGLYMDAILDCSNRGDLILDPFSGSGTLLTAAYRTGRRGAAIELDPIYVDTSVKRLCAASGLIACLPDGRTFEEVEADRQKEAVDA